MNKSLKYKWSIGAKQRLKTQRNSFTYIKSISGPNSPVWRGGISKTNKTSYESVKDRMPAYIEIRRDPSNYYVLQTKCMQCNKWFAPNGRVTNKKLIGNKSLNFFCSIKCNSSRYKKAKSFIIKTSMYKGIVKRNKELNKLNKKIKREQKRKLNRIKQLKLRKKRIESTKKYGKYAVKRKQKEQLTQEFKKHHPNRYIQYKHSTAGMWFEIKRWQSPPEWRISRMLVLSKRRAKQLNIEFNLDKGWCRRRVYRCEATNIKFDNSYEGTFITMNPYAPSVDRIDNTKGYTKDNCRLVLTMFNSLKSTLTDKELYENLKKFVMYYKIV